MFKLFTKLFLLTIVFCSLSISSAHHRSPYGGKVFDNPKKEFVNIVSEDISIIFSRNNENTFEPPKIEVTIEYVFENNSSLEIIQPLVFSGHVKNIEIFESNKKIQNFDEESTWDMVLSPYESKNIRVVFDSFAFFWGMVGHYDYSLELILPIGTLSDVNSAELRFQELKDASFLGAIGGAKFNKNKNVFVWNTDEWKTLKNEGTVLGFIWSDYTELLNFADPMRYCSYVTTSPWWKDENIQSEVPASEIEEYLGLYYNSSYLIEKNQAYTACNLIRDTDISTVWAEGVEGDGIGEWFSVPVYGDRLHIRNGFVKDKKLWEENNRVKKLRMYNVSGSKTGITDLDIMIDDLEYEFIFELEDTSDEQIVLLPQGIEAPLARFEILEVYKGTKYDDTVISDVNSSWELPGFGYFTSYGIPGGYSVARHKKTDLQKHLWTREWLNKMDEKELLTKAEAANLILGYLGEDFSEFKDKIQELEFSARIAQERGIIDDVNSVNQNVNVAEFAVMVGRGLGLSLKQGENWYSSAMDHLASEDHFDSFYSKNVSPETFVPLHESLRILLMFEVYQPKSLELAQ